MLLTTQWKQMVMFAHLIRESKENTSLIAAFFLAGTSLVCTSRWITLKEVNQQQPLSILCISVQVKTLHNYNFTTFFKTFSPLDSQNSWSVSLFKTTGGIGLILKVVQHMVTSCVCLMYVYLYTHISVGQIEPKYNELWINQILTSLARFLT